MEVIYLQIRYRTAVATNIFSGILIYTPRARISCGCTAVAGLCLPDITVSFECIVRDHKGKKKTNSTRNVACDDSTRTCGQDSVHMSALPKSVALMRCLYLSAGRNKGFYEPYLTE